MAEILEGHGKIDNLVTSAGFTENFEATAYPIDRVRKLWGVNVDGTYLFATAVARHLVSLLPPPFWMRCLVFFSHISEKMLTSPRWSERQREVWSLLGA